MAKKNVKNGNQVAEVKVSNVSELSEKIDLSAGLETDTTSEEKTEVGVFGTIEGVASMFDFSGEHYKDSKKFMELYPQGTYNPRTFDAQKEIEIAQGLQIAKAVFGNQLPELAFLAGQSWLNKDARNTVRAELRKEAEKLGKDDNAYIAEILSKVEKLDTMSRAIARMVESFKQWKPREGAEMIILTVGEDKFKINKKSYIDKVVELGGSADGSAKGIEKEDLKKLKDFVIETGKKEVTVEPFSVLD